MASTGKGFRRYALTLGMIVAGYVVGSSEFGSRSLEFVVVVTAGVLCLFGLMLMEEV